MSTAPTLTTYKFAVFGGDIANPEHYMVESLGRDVQRAEMEFARRGWGKTESRPMTSAAMVTFYAMTRLGMYSGRWEDFENWYLSIEPEEPVRSNPTDAERELD